MKPVKCGCGGEAYIDGNKRVMFHVSCDCGMMGPLKYNPDEAIAAWNIAMSADLREKLNRLRSYVQHRTGCEQFVTANGFPNGCSCGLDAAMKGEET